MHMELLWNMNVVYNLLVTCFKEFTMTRESRQGNKFVYESYMPFSRPSSLGQVP